MPGLTVIKGVSRWTSFLPCDGSIPISVSLSVMSPASPGTSQSPADELMIICIFQYNPHDRRCIGLQYIKEALQLRSIRLWITFTRSLHCTWQSLVSSSNPSFVVNLSLVSSTTCPRPVLQRSSSSQLSQYRQYGCLLFLYIRSA